MAFTLSHSTALLLIDFQKDFVGATLPVINTAEILPRAKQVLAAARQAKLPIIHTQEIHRKELVDFGRELDGAEPVHCLEHWPGSQFYPELTPVDGEFIITKRRYSAFFATDLEILLKGLQIKTVVLMGALTNVCVHYTALDAHQHDYHFHVLEDCCIGSDEAAHEAALRAMMYLQRRSRIKSFEFITATQPSLTVMPPGGQRV